MDGMLIEAGTRIKSLRPQDAVPPPHDGERSNSSWTFTVGGAPTPLI